MLLPTPISSEEYKKIENKPMMKLLNTLMGEQSRAQRNLEGQMLTIIDASFPDREQREAVKSLVRQAVWSGDRREIPEIICQFSEKYEKKEIEQLVIPGVGDKPMIAYSELE